MVGEDVFGEGIYSYRCIYVCEYRGEKTWLKNICARNLGQMAEARMRGDIAGGIWSND